MGTSRTAARERFAFASRVVVAWCLACLLGCAEGLPAYPEIGSDEPSLIATPPVFVVDASAGTGATPMELPMQAGTGAPVMGEPCTRGDEPPCACPDTTAQGIRVCLANAASPSGGFFTECLNCPAPVPDAGDPCSNAMKDGVETAIDCGGGACGPCAIGEACAVAGDCVSMLCEGQLCVAESAGAGGESGVGATGGAGGAGGTDPSGGTGGMEEPVDECRTRSCDGLLDCCRRDGSCGTRVLLLCL